MGSEIQNLLREDRMYVEPLEKLLNPLILQKTKRYKQFFQLNKVSEIFYHNMCPFQWTQCNKRYCLPNLNYALICTFYS